MPANSTSLGKRRMKVPPPQWGGSPFWIFDFRYFLPRLSVVSRHGKHRTGVRVFTLTGCANQRAIGAYGYTAISTGTFLDGVLRTPTIGRLTKD